MRVLIVSDTHKKHANLITIMEKERPFDRMIHLGDAEGYEDYIAELAGCPLDIVAGNNDFFSELPKEKEIEIGGLKALITHGHYYYVSAGLEDIKKEARGRGMDIVMFGHTHRPLIEKDHGVVALNPGSTSYPRQDGHLPSYIVMEIDANGTPDYQLKYLSEEEKPKNLYKLGQDSEL